MKRFLRTHADQIKGVLSGFDRMRFRGTLRWLAYAQGMKKFLDHIHVLLKDFKAYVQHVTDQVRDRTEKLAQDHGRPLIYLDGSPVSKEERARDIVRRDGITEGLICVFSAVESCFSYEVRRDPDRRWLELRGRPQKCLLQQFHPAHADIFRGLPVEYYWSLEQSEWATDVMFRSKEDLADLYPHLLRHAAYDFSSAEVMRFLGRKTPLQGGVHGRFQGEVVSDVARRTDRLRIKHRVGKNSIKMYDKQDSLLRIETTINDVRDMKVFRRAEAEPDSPKMWRPLRKGVADTQRRARVSQAANERYLDALAEVHASQSLGELTEAISRPTEWNGKRVRAIQPWSPDDTQLLAAVNRPEFTVNGFRNRDLRARLFAAPDAPAQETRRQSARITRQLRMLRAHGLITKVPQTHRYQLTVGGRQILAALQAARSATAEQLANLAA